jgi:hypothetical protein
MKGGGDGPLISPLSAFSKQCVGKKYYRIGTNSRYLKAYYVLTYDSFTVIVMWNCVPSNFSFKNHVFYHFQAKFFFPARFFVSLLEGSSR